jgi:hypothetical protein
MWNIEEESSDEDLPPSVHYSTIIQEEPYEDEDFPELEVRPWDPSEPSYFFLNE